MTTADKLDGSIVRRIIDDICKFDVQITQWCVAYEPNGKAVIPGAVYEQIKSAFRLIERLQYEISNAALDMLPDKPKERSAE